MSLRASQYAGQGFARALTLVALATAYPLHAESWWGELNDGSRLEVDPSTRRAMRHSGGSTHPIWDGAHRLDDGSVVIVRSGQAVPNEEMIRVWSGESAAKDQVSVCEQLVRKVCGLNDECKDAEACKLSRDLLELQTADRSDAERGKACIGALEDPAFPECGVESVATTQSACKRLAERVCGTEHQCVSDEACDPARQLVQLELEERRENLDPNAPTKMGLECERAIDNPFFVPCER